MRILHVVPTYLPAERYGGPIHSVHGLCSALAAAGHDVQVFTTSVDGPRDSDVPHGTPVVLDGVRVTYFRSATLRRVYYAPSMQPALHEAMAQCDIAHLHSVFLWPTSAVARSAVRHAVPYVVSPRGMLVRELIEKKSRNIKRAWLSLVEARTLGEAAAIHLTSHRELSDARSVPVPLPSPFVVPNGVYPPGAGFEQRAAERIRRLSHEPYALYLGRLNWKKGLDRMLRALAHTDVRVVLCGSDDEGYRSQLERIARDAGLGARAAFEPPVSGDDKWALLANARFVVLPSYNENFGNVVIEAMSVGRPVVITEEVGAGEIVRAAGAGLICSGRTDDLTAAMQRAWHDRPMREQQSAAGAAYVAAHLGWRQVADQMLAQYARIIAGGRDRAALRPHA